MESLAQVVWRSPEWFGLALAPWLLWGLRALAERRRGDGYAEPHLRPWVQARPAGRLSPAHLWRHGALALAWLLFAAALAGPRLELTRHASDSDSDPELLVVLDLSRSMSARDVVPSRVERARLELEDLVTRADRLRIGLVVFAARAHLMVPPTDDKALLRHYLQQLRHGLLPTEGSNLEGALAFAAEQFTPGEHGRALLVVSDGELPDADAAADARLEQRVTELAQQGIALHALGIGSARGAPLMGVDGEWLVHQDRQVVSRLDERRLQRLAALGNGAYARVADSDAEWRTLYDNNLRHLRSGGDDAAAEALSEWRELFGWLLVPGVLLWLLAASESGRRPGASAPLLLILLLAGGTPPPAHAAGASEARAHAAYSREAFVEARQLYARLPGYAGRLGEGSSAYRLGDYRAAVQLFTQAVLDAQNDRQRARALFNLANSHYRLEAYAVAADHYREVLQYAPDHAAAEGNLGFALAMQAQEGGTQATEGRRSGRGPRSERLSDETEVVDGRLTLGDDDEGAEPFTPTGEPVAPLTGTERIERGIFHARHAARSDTEREDTRWHYAATSEGRVARLAHALESDESLLWQRIFEAEEGFPWPVETPYELPGHAPW